MDDDEEEREFSREIVYGFFDQARNTFGDMDTARWVGGSPLFFFFSLFFPHPSLFYSPLLHSSDPFTPLTVPRRQNQDLPKLSSLGHFLKGSSATLGLSKVRDACERIQHLGQRKSDANAQEGTHPDEWYLARLAEVISQVKADVHVVERMLKTFYGAERT